MKTNKIKSKFAVTPEGKERYQSEIFNGLRTSFEIEGIKFSDARFKKLQEVALKRRLHLSK